MSQGDTRNHQQYTPPPSYEEAVLGIPPSNTNRQDDSLPLNPFTLPPIHAPSAPQQYPILQYDREQYTPPQHHPQLSTPAGLYNACPSGIEPLINLNEILVYPAHGFISGYKLKVRDQNKTTIFTIKYESEESCCDCCEPGTKATYTLRNLDGSLKLACAKQIVDSYDCCSVSEKHQEVRAPLDVPLGIVRLTTSHTARVENMSGDVLYKLERKKSWWDTKPYKIHTTDGRLVGNIDNKRGDKHRLTLPRDMPVQHKLSLLFFTAYLQKLDDDNNSGQQQYS